jgi:hypothetical protein
MKSYGVNTPREVRRARKATRLVLDRRVLQGAQFTGKLTGGGGGSKRIWFTIEEVECVSPTETILYVRPTWYTGGCTAAIPGEDSYGIVTVGDVCAILQYYTADWLPGQTGSATYMYPRDGYCEPKWLVDEICGSPECA